MLADYHIHTCYSDDSEYPMEDVVKDAISLGLDEICFTDHVDYGVKRDWDDPRGWQMWIIPAMLRKSMPLRKNTRIRSPSKWAWNSVCSPIRFHNMKSCIQLCPFDFIILSVHQVEDREFWTQDFQRGRTQEEYNLRYYEEMLALVQRYHNYSVLGHMDLITRYDKAGIFPFEIIRPIIKEILKTIIADGKGIEVNTSCHRYGLNDLTPSTDILRLYRDLGGRIITIGSDSHRKEHLGAYLTETISALKAIGYKEVYTFKQMCPIPHKL